MLGTAKVAILGLESRIDFLKTNRLWKASVVRQSEVDNNLSNATAKWSIHCYLKVVFSASPNLIGFFENMFHLTQPFEDVKIAVSRQIGYDGSINYQGH